MLSLEQKHSLESLLDEYITCKKRLKEIDEQIFRLKSQEYDLKHQTD